MPKLHGAASCEAPSGPLDERGEEREWFYTAVDWNLG